MELNNKVQAELIELIEKWNNTDTKIYKQNIQNIIRSNNIQPKDIINALGLIPQTLYSYYTPSHKSKIDFVVALKLANYLGVTLYDFMD